MPIKFYDVPEEIIRCLRQYAYCKTPPPGSIRNILENKLYESISSLDDENKPKLTSIMEYIYSELPSACWGSSTAVDSWLKKPGMSPEALKIKDLLLLNPRR